MSTSEKYSRIQIALHWLIAILLLVNFISHDGMKAAWDAFERTGEATQTTGALVHANVGLAILALAVLRLIVRLVQGAPASLPGPVWQERLSGLTHLALYGLLFAIPASGAAAWFYGIEAAGEVHEVLFNLGLAIVGLHAAAAIYHQFVLKDGLMNRMR